MFILHSLLTILWPKICISCKNEGTHLCEDCLATISPNKEVFSHNSPSLTGLLSATSIKEPLIQKALAHYKNPPFLRDLSSQFAFLIISHVLNSHNEKLLNNSVLLPISVPKKEQRRRGFNHIKEITKQLSSSLNIPIVSIKELPNKRILLVDDIYDTGERMEDMASKLKKQGAQDIWGMVIAR
ncbi:MAG TPA: ComF family protein [Candidatus Wildermuthbacteria bacterium]|nr:ComF family protein [Candidatus Wildermuthbacteria bacterium]